MSPLLAELYAALVDAGFFRGSEERPLIARALEEVERAGPGDAILVQLPTGYGKTAIPHTLALASFLDGGLLQRAIHALPLRSIADDVWRRFGLGLGAVAPDVDAREVGGLQMMGSSGSPFLNRAYVATTFDTLAMCCFKVVPAELQRVARGEFRARYPLYGHYEVARGAVAESMVVFDEPHLLVEAGGQACRAYQALSFFLMKVGVPAVHMSATITPHLRRGLERLAAKAGVGLRVLSYGDGFRDPGFEAREMCRRVETRLVDAGEPGEVARLVRGISETWDRVLVVVNTVRRARELWRLLEGAALLHGRMTGADRASALSLLGGKRWIAVATQVVEAGVDVSAQVLVTDAAPASSLVQRAGRVCRRPSDGEGEVVVLAGPQAVECRVYPKELVTSAVGALKSACLSGKRVYWRIPHAEEGLGYQDLVNASSRPLEHGWLGLYNLLLPYSKPSSALVKLLSEGLCRDSPLIPLVVSDEPVEVGVGEFYRLQVEMGFAVSPAVLRQMLKEGVKPLVVYADRGRAVAQSCPRDVKEVAFGELPQLRMLLKGILALQVGSDDYRRIAY